MIKKLHPEVLENRALLAAIQCETRFDILAECVTNTNLEDTHTANERWYIESTPGTLGSDVTAGTVSLTSSSTSGYDQFTVTLNNLSLVLRDGTAVKGRCDNIKASSSLEGNADTLGVCDFGTAGKVSGDKNSVAAGFYDTVTFGLTTTTPLNPGAAVTLNKGTLKFVATGLADIPSNAVIKRIVDTDQGTATVVFNWCPKVTDGTNAIQFRCLENFIAGVWTSDGSSSGIVSMELDGSTPVKDPNINLDNLDKKSRDKKLEATWAQFPI